MTDQKLKALIKRLRDQNLEIRTTQIDSNITELYFFNSDLNEEKELSVHFDILDVHNTKFLRSDLKDNDSLINMIYDLVFSFANRRYLPIGDIGRYICYSKNMIMIDNKESRETETLNIISESEANKLESKIWC